MMSGTSAASAGSSRDERQLELAFLPLHKRALGTGVGAALALLVFLFTMIHLARADTPYPLSLLSQYLYGYSVSVTGALIGVFWSAVAGFVAGWFFAFCRNMVVAISTFIVRTRAELAEVRDFLDHI